MTDSRNTREQKRIKKLNLLSEIASLYYEHDLTQSEIAEKFYLSRSRISRLLKQARDKGIVKISVRQIGERSYELEQMLKRKFSLKDAIVLNTNNYDDQQVLSNMGILAAKYLKSHIKPGQVIGISWGRSISAAISAMEGDKRLKPEVVQIIGGTLIQNPYIDISSLMHRMITKFNATGVYLNAPLYVSGVEPCENLKKQPVIAYALEKARHADIILTGVGDVAEDTLATLWSGYDNQAELDEIVSGGAVGFISAQSFDIYGHEIQTGFNQRVIGVTLDELKNAKMVVAISGGKKKAAAVLGALRGKYAHVIVTDRCCVHEMLKLEEKFPVK